MNRNNYEVYVAYEHDYLDKNISDILETKSIDKNQLNKVIDFTTKKTKHYIGIFFLNDHICLEILPKIFYIRTRDVDSSTFLLNRVILLRLLDLTEKIKLGKDGNISMKDFQRGDMLNVIYISFVKRLYQLLKNEMPVMYKEERRISPYLVGKLNPKKQLQSLYSRPQFFHVIKDNLTLDNSLNQVFKFALKIIFPTLPSHVRWQAAWICNIYSKVSDVPPYLIEFVIDNARRLINRLLSGYLPLLEIASMIIRHRYNMLSRKPSAFGSPSISADMNVVFEDLVTFTVKKAAQRIFDGETPVVDIQKIFYFGEVILRPDIVLQLPTKKFTVIIDAKYKLMPNESRPDSNDLYQMYTYTAYFKEEISDRWNQKDFNVIGLLIYPQHLNSVVQSSSNIPKNVNMGSVSPFRTTVYYSLFDLRLPLKIACWRKKSLTLYTNRMYQILKTIMNKLEETSKKTFY